ncbi:PD-(D/E)XK nuclease family transposase, partial [Breznakiellaceae bacterium SP9]
HFINMTKFRAMKEKDIKNNLLDRWMSFLDKMTPSETIEELTKMDTAIQKTAGQMDTLLRDPEALRLYHLRGMGMSDWTSGINDARKSGRIEEKEKTAKNALRKGLPLDLIQDLTGLSIERIQELQANIQV